MPFRLMAFISLISMSKNSSGQYLEPCAFNKYFILFKWQVIPIHCRAEKVLFSIGLHRAIAQSCQKVPASFQPTADAGDGFFLTLFRKVKENIECNDCVKTCQWKIQLCDISANESCLRDIYPCEFYLLLRKINSNYPMMCCQGFCYWNPGATPQVEILELGGNLFSTSCRSAGS